MSRGPKSVVCALSFLCLSGLASAQAPASQAGKRLRLEDLERIALENNPTLAQAAAAVRAAAGSWRQAGAYPNPVIGYQGEGLTPDKERFTRQTEHVLLLEQRIVTAGKLSRGRRALEHAKLQAEAGQEAQRQRVRNAVRGLYYDALAAQVLVDVRSDLARLAHEAVGISKELYNVGQADRPDVLQAEIEAQRAELDLLAAQSEHRRVWEVLAAVVGDLSLAPATLEGDLETDLPSFDAPALLARLIGESPELRAAQAGARRAQAEVERARAERIGDIVVQAGLGYDYDRSHGLGGWMGVFSVQFPLPLFDRRKGAVAAARAEADLAEQEQRRLELALRARLASALHRYETARGRAERHRTAIIPHAQQAHRLYLDRFREMGAAYPQVLIAQRSLFQARADHVAALSEVWHEAALIQGFLLTGGLEAPESRHAGDGDDSTRERP